MIKPVDEIPQSVADRRQSYRDMIRKDIQEAIDRGVKRFEFDGPYNYRYLAQYAREEVEGIVRKKVYAIHDERKKAGFDDPSVPYWHISRVENLPIYRITSHKTEDKTRPRVFCELWPENFEPAYMKLVEVENLREADRKKRKELEKAKLKMEADDETETISFSAENT